MYYVCMRTIVHMYVCICACVYVFVSIYMQYVLVCIIFGIVV